MCGIAGLFEPKMDPGMWPALLERMADTLVHRGPDDYGLWFDSQAGLGFAHRRLAVLDLSTLGRQPMTVRDRWTLVYNGEVYNFRQLRAELEREGWRFRSGTDSEVVLCACVHWGVENALQRFNGMFAFGLYDRRERRLVLARDRFGEKPLYYGRVQGGSATAPFAFASSLAAFRVLPRFGRDICRNALAALLRFGYIPAPASIYEGIYKLSPGHLVRWELGRPEVEPVVESYWNPAELALPGAVVARDDQEAVDELQALLTRSVEQRLVADVPVGAFLSGGVDSTAVVAAAMTRCSKPIRTYSIGFHQDHFDEAPFARRIARHLGTDHTELYMEDRHLEQVIPRLPEIYDEPFADASQVPTALVAALARRDVKVSLSGDGGDELFGGYVRYKFIASLWSRLRWVPGALRSVLARALLAAPASLLAAAAIPARWEMRRVRARRPFEPEMLRGFAPLLASSSMHELYGQFISVWRDSAEILAGEEAASALVERRAPEHLDREARMMFEDLCQYLPDDLLVKVDRAAMAVGLETRIPLLDPDIARFAWTLPAQQRRRGGTTKWILRQVVSRQVPLELIEPAKRGFGVPLADWLRGPLRSWAADLLSADRIRAEGYFRADTVGARWREHGQGGRDWSTHLWYILMFQQWLESTRQ